MISPERLDLMQRAWVRLLDTFGVSPADAYPPFDRLAAAYTEPHRHYHTLEHLGEVFRVVGRLPTANPGAVQLAVWYHDAVYDPAAPDNEGRSAALASAELAAVGIGADVRERVAALVRATAHLTAADEPADPDAVALRDADLAILGASEARYRRYAADIRREYRHVPDAAYRVGRAKVLEGFLARPRIYRTDRLFAEGEEAARRNIAGELSSL